MLAYLNVVQVIGVAATLITIWAFTFKNDRHMRILAALASFVWAAHYELLADHSAASIFALIGVRNLLSDLTKKLSIQAQRLVAGFFIGLFVTATYLTWRDWTSMLPLLASVNATLAYMFLSKVRMRHQLIASDASLALNAVVAGSLGGIVTHLVAMAMHAMTAKRIKKATGLSVACNKEPALATS